MSSGPVAEPATELGRLRILSEHAAIRVSPLQLGAMSLGDAWAADMKPVSKPDAFALLDAYVAAGGNFIDTANGYQNEQTEEWLGEWMEARQNRDSLVIATKYTMNYRAHALGDTPVAGNHGGNSRRSAHISLRDSLRKLRTDYVDILYVHWWDSTASIREVMDTLHGFVQQGRVMYLGVSNTPAWIVSAASQYALDHGKTPFAIYQGRWNVMRRDLERDIIPMARRYGMALAPWDVLGGGRFQSPEQLAARKAAGDGIRAMFTDGPELSEAEVKISAALAEVAAEHGIKSLTAVALAYVMSKASNVFPLVGGRRVEHLDDNIRALSIRLTPEQIARLEETLPFDVGYPMNQLGEDPNVSGDSKTLEAWCRTPLAFPNAHPNTSL